MVGGLVLAVARMCHDDLDGGAVESNGGGGRTVAASFRRTMIPRRAASGGKWLRVVGLAIDKGLDDDDDCKDGDGNGG